MAQSKGDSPIFLDPGRPLSPSVLTNHITVSSRPTFLTKHPSAERQPLGRRCLFAERHLGLPHHSPPCPAQPQPSHLDWVSTESVLPAIWDPSEAFLSRRLSPHEEEITARRILTLKTGGMTAAATAPVAEAGALSVLLPPG